MKTVQQRGPSDLAGALHRHLVLNHVVLAEINFFQKEKVDDLNMYLKTLVDEQIQFYEKVKIISLDSFHSFCLFLDRF